MRGMHPVGVVLVLALLAAPGCGGRGHYVTRGGIEVVNSPFSFEFIDAVRVSESLGPHLEFFDVFLVPGDSLVVRYLVPTLYDVTTYWGDGSLDVFFDVAVHSGWVTEVVAEN